jgi:hypothetical protein
MCLRKYFAVWGPRGTSNRLFRPIWAEFKEGTILGTFFRANLRVAAAHEETPERRARRAVAEGRQGAGLAQAGRVFP